MADFLTWQVVSNLFHRPRTAKTESRLGSFGLCLLEAFFFLSSKKTRTTYKDAWSSRKMTNCSEFLLLQHLQHKKIYNLRDVQQCKFSLVTVQSIGAKINVVLQTFRLRIMYTLHFVF